MSYSVPPPLPDLPGKPWTEESANNGTTGSKNTNSSQSIQLKAPSDINSYKLHVINELASSKELLQGLFETSSEGEAIYSEQRAMAEANINRAKELLIKIDKLESLRSRTNEELTKAKELEAEWSSIEQQMYRSLQPFSLPALKSKLEYATKDSESLSDVLASSFLDGSNNEDVRDFIKNYRKERTTYYLRKERLQRWNEDRVSQM